MNQDREVMLSGRSLSSGKGIDLTIGGGRILKVAESDLSPDSPYLSPGFFDIQVNGFAGIDYTAANFNTQHVHSMIGYVAASGTTRHLPTIVTSPKDRMLRNLRVIADAIESSPEAAAAIPGIHIEGPFISSEDGPRGAHDPAFVRDPSLEEFVQWQDAAGGRIRLITLAPERKGALEFIQAVSAQNVVVGIGHTAASPECIREAVAAGARFSTHLGNGCQNMLPRLRNHVWEQLAEDRLCAGLIADGHHLPAAVVKAIWRVKGSQRIVLVSDVATMGGKKPGVYRWGNIDVQVYEDGHLGLAGTEYLAGAGHLLDRCIAQFVKFANVGLEEAIRLCTVNPSALLDTDVPGEPFQPGLPADLTLFDWHDGFDRLAIRKTLLHGEELFASK
ncbi:MAG: amidohydrolase family protein [Candidatus Atribacteria bacterium]|nr:amidohydrolase family protein [Candidatus Atribacteria bacterium]